MKDSLYYSQPLILRSPKKELLSFCLAIIVTYIVDSRLLLGGGRVGREGLAVYLGKKCNERLGIVSFRFE